MQIVTWETTQEQEWRTLSLSCGSTVICCGFMGEGEREGGEGGREVREGGRGGGREWGGRKGEGGGGREGHPVVAP